MSGTLFPPYYASQGSRNRWEGQPLHVLMWFSRPFVDNRCSVERESNIINSFITIRFVKIPISTLIAIPITPRNTTPKYQLRQQERVKNFKCQAFQDILTSSRLVLHVFRYGVHTNADAFACSQCTIAQLPAWHHTHTDPSSPKICEFPRSP